VGGAADAAAAHPSPAETQQVMSSRKGRSLVGPPSRVVVAVRLIIGLSVCDPLDSARRLLERSAPH